MKQFNIYTDTQGVCEAVKQGWSWPAFFFGIFWALVKKMWVLGGGVFAVYVVLGVVGVVAGVDAQILDMLSNIVAAAFAIIFGIHGNEWRTKNLLSRGFDFKNTVTAANGKGAIALYMKDNAENQNS